MGIMGNFARKIYFFWVVGIRGMISIILTFFKAKKQHSVKNSLFPLEKSLRTAKRLVTTLNETHALMFREYVAEKTKSNPEQFKPDGMFWFHSCVFVLEF